MTHTARIQRTPQAARPKRATIGVAASVGVAMSVGSSVLLARSANDWDGASSIGQYSFSSRGVFRVDRRFSTRFVVGAGYEGNPNDYICNAVGYPQRQVVCGSLERDGQHGFGIVGYGVDASINSRFYLRAEARFVFFGRRRGGGRPIILPVLGAGVRF